jgi:chromosome partitioning protein
MIPLSDAPGQFAKLPRRTAIAEAQAEGAVLWEMKKTSAREAWRDIEPSVVHLGRVLTAVGGHHVA